MRKGLIKDLHKFHTDISEDPIYIKGSNDILIEDIS